jgi:uncharacterized membrane protein YeiH
MSLLSVIELLAVIATAVYGILLAVRKEMDVVGLFTVSFGGGTLRDLFLDRQPLFWIAHPHLPLVVLVLAILGSVLPRVLNKLERFLLLPDALGMGLFTVAGTQYALDAGSPWFICALMGAITGTFGGVIGDMLCNDIPSLFRPAPLNATCSFAGAGVYVLLSQLQLPGLTAAIIGVVVVFVFRLVAVRWNLQLPAVRLPDAD